VSRFTIGFEVEKNNFHRGAVKEYELLKGFERDSSCGYEAITHVLPLLPAGTWRTKVFDMMHKAERIIDDRYSPSDEKDYDGNYKCGGHITLGVAGMTGNELMEATRKYSGIMYAMFRKRLKNKRITPLVVSMYNGDKDKAKMVLSLAGEFQDYINMGVKTENVRDFIPYSL
jgi:hypothetical protein